MSAVLKRESEFSCSPDALGVSTHVAEVPSGVALRERLGEGGEVVVELRGTDGELVVEYRPGVGRCRIQARAVELAAETDLSLRAGRRVEIEAEQGVALRAGASAVSVSSERVGIVAGMVETEARRMVQRVGELETHAHRVLERARESFREVEDLAQTHAGRLRLVAKDSLRALARQASLKAREDMKLRGERIYLE